MDPAIAYGQVLRVLRKEAGMSQEQLAFAADIERNFVSLIERGINQPTVRVIFKLASALQVSPSKMIGLVEEKLAM
ncbi:helix-turn-helix transcriptional regulator [Janthinobacterium sp. SUN073]|uniref:helix-turn-helix domain-containing protein n=1 Tax=Janthinobacterium sp. SUN073 TaxID=3004102 RepID=UPI0025AFFD7B|nr:helix-turn-helix transcriptional regulator [Janthinobacterium sp. SUN073]MDN2698348.1 helix-turn-helix transcriptional regulator [Janthinobacterium sp. SUN073]